MKSYPAYKHVASGKTFVLRFDYVASLDHEQRYLLLSEYANGRLYSPTVVPLEDMQEDREGGPLFQENGTATVPADSEEVAKTADAILQALISRANGGSIKLNVAYDKAGRVVTIDGPVNLNELLGIIL